MTSLSEHHADIERRTIAGITFTVEEIAQITAELNEWHAEQEKAEELHQRGVNMVKVNGKYLVCGHYVKVVKVTDEHIEVVHGHNGTTPRRQCDRFKPLSLIPYFKEVPSR
jgi:hypothetical protein